ncbi:hypothetical protein DKT68_09620 [Micromonospora acroterricola]|uniref:CopC domain-containing protein n=1 Tax=Micromonospora acroterricola TaxID=2202421 RepID=A0A317D659_9ACTN|nr:hypothetical protein [Micromonospora acroterricola]PWR10219.1 hypothetical protein DKT68_09620 [Micromonospora acroterricola]
MTRTRKVFAALLAGLALALLSAAPATAHTGKLKLTVAGDGADGVTVQATYADGHRLDRPVRLVLTGTGPEGRRLGPVQLEPAPEGQGFYSSGALLSPGAWKVTVSAPAPNKSEATATVRARAAQSPPAPAPVPATGPATDARAAAAGSAWWWPVGLAALVLTALAVAVPMLLSRRPPGTRND